MSEQAIFEVIAASEREVVAAAWAYALACRGLSLEEGTLMHHCTSRDDDGLGKPGTLAADALRNLSIAARKLDKAAVVEVAARRIEQ